MDREKDDRPLFSIIIPTRNRSSLLSLCVKSVIDQIYENWELIIVDDGSEDDTADVVSELVDARIRYYYQEHKERSSARNHGIDQAKGRYICFVDDDDYITRTYLSDFHDYYKANNFPDLILRTGFLREIGDKKVPTENYNPRKHKNPVNYVVYNMCGVGSLVIPAVALNQDTFPVKFPHWQDTHLFIRLLMKFEMVQLPSFNYMYVIHDQMGSKKGIHNYDPVSRADLNVRAIEDLFESEKDSIYNYVAGNTLGFLVAEKYLEYALNCEKKYSNDLIRKSLSKGLYTALWKFYLIVAYKSVFS